ncbi:MAG: hypothetical protein ACI87H_002145 [Gammaproteobacteria bacterium]|jgi:hypothetical protein
MSRSRIIGTVEEALRIEESLLGRKLPQSFRDWLLENNGADLRNVHIFPVRDERDTRKTWESLSYLLRNEWAEALKQFKQTTFSHLLPFADVGTIDYYCFDYSVPKKMSEQPVALWSRETGETNLCADNFRSFVQKIQDGVIV